jgi:MoaA/NifB/PqqE/SkfB family radical SAM enzyme
MKSQYRLQEAPFTIKLTLCLGCNLYCSFCGLRGIREEKVHNFQFMTFDTATVIAKQVADLGWRSKLEFTGKGEPTMNPEFVELVRIFRHNLPRNQLMMTSNGGGFLRKPGAYENVKAVFEAGLNVLVLDDYKTANIVPKIRRALENGLPEGVVAYEYNGKHGTDGNPYRRYGPKTRMITFMMDLAETQELGGIRSHMSNHAGAAAPPNDRMKGKRCHRPFRELDIRWDGSIALCCNDWRGAYKCGSLIETPIGEIWQGPEFNAARRKLYHGMRDFSICKGCDSYSGKPGLLPDPQGKHDIPKPDKADLLAIAKATEGAPYTAPVLRPWEK